MILPGSAWWWFAFVRCAETHGLTCIHLPRQEKLSLRQSHVTFCLEHRNQRHGVGANVAIVRHYGQKEILKELLSRTCCNNMRYVAGHIGRNVASAASEYVPSPLDPSVVAAQVAVILFIAAALPTAWWLIVVPTSRKKLATDKRRGAKQPSADVLDGDHRICGTYAQGRLSIVGNMNTCALNININS